MIVIRPWYLHVLIGEQQAKSPCLKLSAIVPRIVQVKQ